MQLHTHLISGWCVGNLVRLSAKERLLCMVAALLPDLDGVGILIDVKYYHQFHHVVGHSIFVGVLLSALLAAFSDSKWKAAVVYFIVFQVHIALDLLGSGPGWGMYYFWPISSFYLESPYVWELQSWQTTVFFFGLLVWTLWIAYRLRRTPVELVAPRLDKKLVTAWQRFIEK